jgi:uncharacterized membrane protein
MMRRWLLPLLVAAITAVGAYHVALLLTPFALMRVAMSKIDGRMAVNTFGFGDMATADNQPVVRPSPDLSYSGCVFDVSKGPVLLDIAPVPDHYWSVSIFDARTDVAAVRSDRDTGGKPARLALLKSGQQAPQGYEPVMLQYDQGIALVRILLANPGEYPVIDAIRRQSTCRQG